MCRTRASEAWNTVGRPVFHDGLRPPAAPPSDTRTRSSLATPPPAHHPEE
ncbi:hypothetical protein PV779_05125 [Streptomyces sp. ID01-9D]|nr:hypothetical protein [Streptomyces sp. ID01-9D]